MTSVRTTGAERTRSLGLSHVQLLVSDVAASAQWYSAVLGLVPFADDPDIGYVALQHRGGKFVVVLTKAVATTGTEREGRPVGGGLDHLALAVPDGAALEAWATHLPSRHRPRRRRARRRPPSLQLRDPDGIAIELVAP